MFGSAAQLDGIYIYDGSTKIWGKTNVNLTGIGLARSGIFTAVNGTGGGIKSSDGDVVLKGISNTTDRPGVYIEVPIEATVGSVTVSGAGKLNGIKFDSGYSGSIVAGAAVNLIGYSIDGDAIYINKTGSPIISAGTGDITFSGYVESGASNMFGVYAATGVNISSTSGNVIFQASKLDGVSGTGRARLVNAATAATPVFATADSANMAFGSSSGLSFAGNISVNTTNGYISIKAKAPSITGVITAYGLALLSNNQNYTFDNVSNSISSLVADIGTGSLSFTTASVLNIGTYNGVTGITAAALTLSAGGLTDTDDAGITVTGTSTIAITNATGSYDYSGVIAGPVTITKTGAGTQTLSAANTYSGNTTVTTGTLKSGTNSAAGPPASGSFGTGSITVGATAAVLDLNGTSISNNISIGGTGISSAGSIINSSVQAGAVSGTLTLTAASSIGGPGDYTISGSIAGAFGLTKVSANTVLLTGATNATTTTTISSGVLNVGNGGTTGALGSSSITNNGTLRINRSNDLTISSAISGTGAFVKAGAGTLTLSGASSYSGSTTIAGGVLSVSSLANGASNSNIGSSSNVAGETTYLILIYFPIYLSLS
jgi:autotransporter-associated beta strand protein